MAIDSLVYDYEGEVDENDKPHGLGSAKYHEKSLFHTGTWMNGMLHGICKSTIFNFIEISF